MNKITLGLTAAIISATAAVSNNYEKLMAPKGQTITVYWYRTEYSTLFCIPVISDYESVYVGDYWSNIAGCNDETPFCCAVGYEASNVDPFTKRPYLTSSWSLIKYQSEE